MASWPSVDATSAFSLAFAIAKSSFLLQVFCFVLHRDLLNSYARQTVSYWTGSKVPATGYGIVYRSLHYGKVGSQAKFLGQAQATQQVPCFAVASFHTLAVQKNKTFTLAKAFVWERRGKSHQLSENLAFFLRRHPYAIQDSTPGSIPGALPTRGNSFEISTYFATCAQLKLVQVYHRTQGKRYITCLLPPRAWGYQLGS